MVVTVTALCLLFGASALAAPPPRCQRSQPCWPLEADISALRQALDPAAPRSLIYEGPPSSFPCAVPAESPDDQPLYGAGEQLSELYVQSESDRTGRCFVDGFAPEYCLVGTRNSQLEGWQPAFVAWPLTAAHVQTLVLFAVKHNLALCVAGTGHDYLNRHSCDQGLLVRTALLKGAEWQADGTAVRLGAGMTWSEVHEAASERGRLIASGWSITVGIAGWSTGGGRGPLTPSLGWGVDNILGAELVGADGSLVTVDLQGTRSVAPTGEVTVSNSTDLLWALRGGGGSTWGVLTSLTLRAHPIPEGGLTYVFHNWAGTTCGGGLETLHALIDHLLAWSQTLDSRWGPVIYVLPTSTPDLPCKTRWGVFIAAMFAGPSTNTAFNETWSALVDGAPTDGSGYVESFADTWSWVLATAPEYINPVGTEPSSDYVAGLPSTLVSLDQVANGDLAAFLKQQVGKCSTEGWCGSFLLYGDLTGNLGSPQPSDTAISESMRTAKIFLIALVRRSDMDQLYSLGSKTYFSESAYDMPDWKTRLWDEDDYAKLLEIKRQIDPTQVFWCRHCIGDEESFPL
eukprot:TRINITY_DN634_c0_g1_i7.p1 TRINITY_DN634_c0_g1~~TRINITY_DN634_c0_g1_i7.p1  ORF type:complete len:571 (-),score=80.38 TRINITY_DN634_c0_g1_i7:37-1749(-)